MFSTLKELLVTIMTTQAEAAVLLNQVVEKNALITSLLAEASTELSTKIVALQATIDGLVAAAANVTIDPNLKSALDAVIAQTDGIAVQAQVLADIIPNPPVV